MSRLQAEFNRLYGPLPGQQSVSVEAGTSLLGPLGEVRAVVLDVGRPVDWSLVAPLWQRVQDELGLPAPAIAISGSQSFQLWWSLSKAVPAAEAAAFLGGLKRRFLPELPESRVQGFPRATGDADRPWAHAPAVPSQVSPDQWSAFVAPGLAPVFEETPWLDFPPNVEGQADLLRGLASVTPAAWQEAQARIAMGMPTVAAGLPAVQSPGAAAIVPPGQVSGAETTGAVATLGAPGPSALRQDPRSFLMQVMNDERVPLPLRIEAAKALLPYTPD